MIKNNDFLATLTTNHRDYQIFRIDRIEKMGLGKIARLPFTIRVLLEGVIRNLSKKGVHDNQLRDLAAWKADGSSNSIVPFFPGRIVMQDFSGVPVVVDLAAMRSAMSALGGDPGRIKPIIPVDVVIDHSIQVDRFGTADAARYNTNLEYERNSERYRFLRWAQNAFDHLTVLPPSTGIIHQINLEHLTSVVLSQNSPEGQIAFPDTLVGTDSHTTMINGLGVVGWGVGGIEAVSAMLGQPIEILLPEVIGVKLIGQLPEGTTPTDLTLSITQILRSKGVVNKFIEFHGAGFKNLSLADRAMIANMSPEYGATVTFFPIDDHTLDYLKLTGKPADLIDLVERYAKEQHLFYSESADEPEFSDSLEIDLGSIEPSLAGPKRPQDRVSLSMVKSKFHSALTMPKTERGFGLMPAERDNQAVLTQNGTRELIKHGSVVIASITSCTNTSNPFVMIGAGLLAKKAVQRGLQTKPYVKTSLAPGSRVVTEYLKKAGLLEPLEKLGFNLVGYGCTTCIGNSGPLSDPIVKIIQENNLVVAAVLSGNRNFEGRVSPHTQANYLASPPLVVAYALAGTVDVDMYHDPLGFDKNGVPVYLKEIWPSTGEILATMGETIEPDLFKKAYENITDGDKDWQDLESGGGELYDWNAQSTYLQQPPYFAAMSREKNPLPAIKNARVLALLGDSITTDHISPAGAIPLQSPAGQYLVEKGVDVKDFNSYGSRRGNDQVMLRGTFANIRLKNQLLPGVEGGYTIHLPSGEQKSIFEAAMLYQMEQTPLLILAGKEYGTGSSRDWAAKGSMLLGIKAIIAESYERIHRSNLVGMGILPLQFEEGQNSHSLGLQGCEIFDIIGSEKISQPLARLVVMVRDDQKILGKFNVLARLDTPMEVDYYHNGGILQTILYELIQGAGS